MALLAKMHLQIEEINEKLDSRKEVTQKDEQTSDYYVKNLFGEAEIRYGEKAETKCIREIIIVPLKDNLDEYNYYNSDSSTKIRCLSGFINAPSKFTRLRDFKSWSATSGQGPFSNLHKITLPIIKIGKDQELRLKYELKLYGHYQEILPDSNLVSHFFYFRIRQNTKSAVFIFKIPKGKLSKICKIQLETSENKKMIHEKTINLSKGDVFNVGKSFGTGYVKEEKKHLVINWTIPDELKKGTICKLLWYTEPN